MQLHHAHEFSPVHYGLKGYGDLPYPACGSTSLNRICWSDQLHKISCAKCRHLLSERGLQMPDLPGAKAEVNGEEHQLHLHGHDLGHESLEMLK